MYGALKVNEIAWHQIRLYVEGATEATLQNYVLKVSDGVGFATPSAGKSTSGFLLKFKNPETAYRKISTFEGTDQSGSRYKWAKAEVSDEIVNLLELRGSLPIFVEAQSWGLENDEVFAQGIPWLHDNMKRTIKKLEEVSVPGPKTQEYWDAFFQLQGCFLFMWGVQERLEFFRFGVTSNEEVLLKNGQTVSARTMSARRKEMANDPMFLEAIELAKIDKTLEVSDYRSPAGGSKRTSISALSTWYEIRNNITHHAKGSERDIEKLMVASADNFNALFNYLRLISPRLAKEWVHLTTIEKSV